MGLVFTPAGPEAFGAPEAGFSVVEGTTGVEPGVCPGVSGAFGGPGAGLMSFTAGAPELDPATGADFAPAVGGAIGGIGTGFISVVEGAPEVGPVVGADFVSADGGAFGALGVALMSVVVGAVRVEPAGADFVPPGGGSLAAASGLIAGAEGVGEVGPVAGPDFGSDAGGAVGTPGAGLMSVVAGVVRVVFGAWVDFAPEGCAPGTFVSVAEGVGPGTDCICEGVVAPETAGLRG